MRQALRKCAKRYGNAPSATEMRQALRKCAKRYGSAPGATEVRQALRKCHEGYKTATKATNLHGKNDTIGYKRVTTTAAKSSDRATEMPRTLQKSSATKAKKTPRGLQTCTARVVPHWWLLGVPQWRLQGECRNGGYKGSAAMAATREGVVGSGCNNGTPVTPKMQTTSKYPKPVRRPKIQFWRQKQRPKLPNKATTTTTNDARPNKATKTMTHVINNQ